MPKTVLIVDDEESVRFLYTRMFKNEVKSGEFILDFSISGEDALTRIKDGNIENLGLVISDINMPGLSGFELLKEVKEHDQKLPIFMSSAYTDQERQSLAMELGALEYITKPVDFPSLKKKIVEILSD